MHFLWTACKVRLLAGLAKFSRKVIQKLRVAFYSAISDSIEITGKLKKRQPLLTVGNGSIEVVGRATIGYFPSPYYLSSYAHFDFRGHGAKIHLGNDVQINNNSVLIADGSEIRISANCLIGLNVTMMTSDAHSLEKTNRMTADYSRLPITIGENVFVGNNVTILKGVSVGANSVIATGSIVATDIPSDVIAGGVPCKVIRPIT